MSKHFYGSICLTEILESSKSGHPAVVKGSNGKIYVNVSAWLNDTPDQYNNVMNMQLSMPKDRQDLSKIYIGNFKESQPKEPQPVSISEVNAMQGIIDDLPF